MSMGMHLGGIFVSIRADLRPLQRDLRTAAQMVASASRSMSAAMSPRLRTGGMGGGGGLGGTLRIGAAMAGAEALGKAAISGMAQAAKAASDLTEAVNKANVVMGSSAPAAHKMADDLARAFGVDKREALEAASSIAGIATATGSTAEEATELGTRLTRLSLDIASLHNISNQSAFEKMRSGLTGMIQPLRSVGININAYMVKNEAARLGLEKTGKQYSEHAKLIARVSLIEKQAALAKGDMARTANEPANLMRRLSGTMANLSAEMGQRLLAPFQGALRLGLDMLNDLAKAFESNNKYVSMFVDGLHKAVGAVRFIYENFGGIKALVVSLAADAIQIWGQVGQTITQAVSSPVAFALARFGPAFGQLGTELGKVFANIVDNITAALALGADVLGPALAGISEAGQQIAANMGANFLAAFKMLADQLPSLFSRVFEAIGRMADNLVANVVAGAKSIQAFVTSGFDIKQLDARKHGAVDPMAGVQSLRDILRPQDLDLRRFGGVDPLAGVRQLADVLGARGKKLGDYGARDPMAGVDFSRPIREFTDALKGLLPDLSKGDIGQASGKLLADLQGAAAAQSSRIVSVTPKPAQQLDKIQLLPEGGSGHPKSGKFLGYQDLVKSIQESALGKENHQKRTAENTAKTVEILKEIAGKGPAQAIAAGPA